MSTRGAWGIRKNNKEKLGYVHYDSYPDNLGLEILHLIKNTDSEQLSKFYDLIKVVDENVPPTLEEKDFYKDIDSYASYVSSGNDNEWYCLLRGIQDSPIAIYNAMVKTLQPDFPYEFDQIGINNANDFIKDSLFCEYAYIINLDEDCLELYEGFQKTPDETSRYPQVAIDGYYPCKCIGKMSLEKIRDYSINDSFEIMLEKYRNVPELE